MGGRLILSSVLFLVWSAVLIALVRSSLYQDLMQVLLAPLPPGFGPYLLLIVEFALLAFVWLGGAWLAWVMTAPREAVAHDRARPGT